MMRLATMYQSAHIESWLYAVFKFEFNQLLIFIEKFSPLPVFEPGTSPVPSRYATNWAILVWIRMPFGGYKEVVHRVFCSIFSSWWASNFSKLPIIWLNLGFSQVKFWLLWPIHKGGFTSMCHTIIQCKCNSMTTIQCKYMLTLLS